MLLAMDRTRSTAVAAEWLLKLGRYEKLEVVIGHVYWPEHRAEAARHQQVAAQEQAQYEPSETHAVLAPRSPFADNGPGPHLYNPTAEHLNEADRQMRDAFEHLRAAQQLEHFEVVACTGMSVAERSGCALEPRPIACTDNLPMSSTNHVVDWRAPKRHAE